MTHRPDTRANILATLAQQPPRTPRMAVQRAWAGFVAAALLGLLGVIFGLGLRPDLPDVLLTAPFMLKIGLALLCAGSGFYALRCSWYPDSARLQLWPAWAALATIVATSGLSETRLFTNSSAPFLPGWLCAASIMALSVPFTLALLKLTRLYAPTQPQQTAEAMALTASGSAIALFALHCPYSETPFILFWYGSAILATLGAARLTLPKHLRW